MDGFNRGLWIVLGLVFTVAGALGIASYAGWIGGADTRTLAPADLVDEWVDRCLLYTSPSPRDRQKSRMPSSA